MNTFVPGRSWLHLLPASAKLAGLTAAMVAVLLVDSPAGIAAAGGVTVLLYVSAGLAYALPAQVRPLRWLVVGLVALQALTAGWTAAVTVTGRLVVAVVLAGLITLTTRVVDLLDVFERVLRPARRVGVDSERVALVLALAIRAVPVVAGLAVEVRDAQRARGPRGSVRAYAVPLVVRTLRHADALGEALVARGLDDPPPVRGR
ncbi:MAG TPA: energy-coupling factor transporter transmembrane protein EcfT [Jiangellaceae bacterium]|nr:energy-coupling factor transporter transmembrane protein EcfT [Jiangellaceae bacterium]